MRSIEVPVQPLTAATLADDPKRMAAVGRLIDRLVLPVAPGEDELMALLERTAARAEAAGLTDEDVAAELAAYNAERRG